MDDELALGKTLDSSGGGAPDKRAPPPMIGRFVVERELGAGGMGIVSLAHDPTLDRKVAIKLLRSDDGDGGPARTRMLREAQAMARLRHANVAAVHEAGVHDDRVYIVMEYVAGGTLRARLEREPAMEPAAVLALFVAAGRGLAAAHRAGLVHRDFKPENVLVEVDGAVKVTDFGLAAHAGSVEAAPAGSDDALATPLTRTGDVMGTPKYMAPEQHRGGKTDARSDQFAFCVALYEALYHRHPFRTESWEALRTSVLGEPPRPPPDDRRVRSNVRDAIVRGLSRDPDQRFASMDALLDELAPRPGRRWWLVAALGVAAAAAAVTVLAWPSHDDPVAAASRAAQACDCELLTPALPTGARVTAVRALRDGVLGDAQPPSWQPTGQLAIPRGPHVIDYVVDGETYAYAVVSRGGAGSRRIALPAPERASGFVFVPGGEVEIGSSRGAADEQPIAAVELAPYLVERRAPAAVVTFAEAQRLARERHARLPTAAEWEWAARLGLRDGSGWEWTATRFVPYPYIHDERDDALASRDHSEVRGGDAHDIAARRSGAHAGSAGLRLARTPRSAGQIDHIEIAVESELFDDSGTQRARRVIPPRERARLDQFLTDWAQLDDPPPLQVESPPCVVSQVLWAAGVPASRIDQLDHGQSDRVTIRWHPDRTFGKDKPEGRKVVCDEQSEVLEEICFDGEHLAPSAAPILQAIAANLQANTTLKRLEAAVYVGDVPDALVLSRRRADAVVARLVSLGVARDRLVPHGYGFVRPGADPDHGLFGDEAPATAPPTCPHALPGERAVFQILERSR